MAYPLTPAVGVGSSKKECRMSLTPAVELEDYNTSPTPAVGVVLLGSCTLPDQAVGVDLSEDCM